MTHHTRRYERLVLVLMALVQFINIWEFMVVMPLGPDFADALHFDLHHVGWLAGCYWLAGSVSGLLAARFLDRFDRRTALIFCLTGLSVTTAMAALAVDFKTLLLVRVAAGFFGGPTVAVSLAVLSDIFPPERRGEAMGKAMGSFALAAVLGVPLGLEIARIGGWYAPFLVIGGTGLLMVVVIRFVLPPLKLHLLHAHLRERPTFREMAGGVLPLLAMAMIGTTTFSAFLLVPNISAHVQYNLGYPRADLAILYFCGGISSFAVMRVAGNAADRFGFAITSLVGTSIAIGTVYVYFTLASPGLSVPLMFVLFMASSAVRNVTGSAISTKIPKPEHRAGFMSIMSSLQHLTSGAGAFLSAWMLTEAPDGRLTGMENVSWLAIACFTLMPLMMWQIEKRIRKRDAAAA